MLKKPLLFVVLFCASLISMAQDVIVKKDGTTIQSKVLEISETAIRYKKWSNQDGPLYSIKRSSVDSITYQNGEVELITCETNDNLSSAYNHGIMERNGRDLVLNGRKIYGEEVRFLVGEQNYQTYLSARRQMATGELFGAIFWPSFGISVTMIASAFIYNGYYLANETRLRYGGIACLVAGVTLPFMCIFKGIGKGRLNWIAGDYNRNGGINAFSYQLSPSIIQCNSMESQGSPGVGLTFSMSF